MKIAVIGAGLAGVATARTLAGLKHEVSVFDSEPEVGGVWAAARRYPGLCTQNPGCTYHFSELPMPAEYPEWPSGAQVQQYIESYVSTVGLQHVFRFNTKVLDAEFDEGENNWLLSFSTVGDDSSGKVERGHFDFLVIANGVFSRPHLPKFDGLEEWVDGGGKLLHTSELTNLEDARDKQTLVIGYGKSACDAAVALATVSRSTTLAARSIIWKIPRKIGGLINFKHLFFTRFGEGLFPWARLQGFDRFLHGKGKPIVNSALAVVQKIIERQLKLRSLDLHPGRSLDTIARTSISLSTVGFFEAVSQKNIRVMRDTQIKRLLPGRAELTNGEAIPTDFIVAGTGFNQSVPVLSQHTQDQLTSENGDFRLYRGILPVRVPGLAFIGYNSSLMCQLSCEASAMWLAEYLRGGIQLPSATEMDREIDSRLKFHQRRMDGNYFRGTYLVPFSLRPVDELLDDIGLNIGLWGKIKQWLGYARPGAYAKNYDALAKRAGLEDCDVIAPVQNSPLPSENGFA